MIENTRFGFIYNNLTVERICDNKTGTYIYLNTDKYHTDIRITKGGKIKINPIIKIKKLDKK